MLCPNSIKKISNISLNTLLFVITRDENDATIFESEYNTEQRNLLKAIIIDQSDEVIDQINEPIDTTIIPHLITSGGKKCKHKNTHHFNGN